MALQQFSTDIAGRTLTIETGKLAQQAGGSCTVRYGDTVVLATAVMSKDVREGIDYFPLLVDYEERLYAAGKIKGSRFIKREGRPTDEAILTARLVDRSIRPLFDSVLRDDVQVVLTVLSVDQENDPDILSLIGASAALILAKYPTLSPTDIRNILKLSVDPMSLSGKYRNQFGAGRLNVNQAIVLAASYASAQAQQDLQPVSIPVEGYASGDLIKSNSFSSVYYIDSAGKRRVFLDSNAYFTWSNSFSDIKVMNDDELAQFDLGGVMLPKAGVALVKIQSDNSVYMLASGDDDLVPVLRKINSEEIATEMFGSDWADYVIDIEPTFFTKFELGDRIDQVFEVDTSQMKTRQMLAELAE